jgi:probable HAF family extracellular repeat protein
LPWLSTVHTAEALGINDQNDIVGYALDSAQLSHAMLWKSDGSMVDLSQYLPGWGGTTVYDINNNGYMVGTGTNPDGDMRGFLLAPIAEPVPEPSTLALLIIGIAGLIGYGWRRDN